jgi:peptide/nickel transport system ATP-binding protein
MLMASVPRLDKKWDEEIELPLDRSGQAGCCAYFERCPAPEKTELCTKSKPPLVQVEEDHFVACFCYQK